MNKKLKFALIDKEIRQQDMARRLLISDAYLSRIIGGWVKPSDDMKESIAKLLNMGVDELFD